jgi:hypothetical protein
LKVVVEPLRFHGGRLEGATNAQVATRLVTEQARGSTNDPTNAGGDTHE